MTADPKPLLAFGPPIINDRPKRKDNRNPPRLSKASPERQGRRLLPQFKELTAAFEAKRVRIQAELPDEVDPALVVVFDLAGSIKDFCNAINRIDGMEFLSELIGDQYDADDDFYWTDAKTGRTDKPVTHSLYLVMSNIKAIDELLRLFKAWQDNPAASLKHGLGKFKEAFQKLTAIRRWGPEDRIRETGLRERWKEILEVVGQSVSNVLVEVELWYRRDHAQRSHAEKTVSTVITASNGRIVDRSVIAEIGYHALLAELPLQQVESVLANGAESIRLLATDEVMFVSPFTPMNVVPHGVASTTSVVIGSVDRVQGQPRIALLDGLPFQNHDALRGRLLIDDPENLGENYPLSHRQHGTAMASLIIHGDLSQPGPPIEHPLYVRPIMKPQEITGGEVVVPDRLFPDLLHAAIKRIVYGDGSRPPAAPSVRIVNFSIGAESRALTRRMSPIGRLLDWLAIHYNILFVVSAGNHGSDITIPAVNASNVDLARLAARKTASERSLLRGVLPPGDAMNALTVGATHSDAAGEVLVPDTVWDITQPESPAYYGSTGPGVGRSIKPDLYHAGGRALYRRPVTSDGSETVDLPLVNATATPPGLQVAAPDRGGATNSTLFTCGTSNATALVSREASRLFDILETSQPESEDSPLPDAQYHPLLVRALLVHASSWGDWDARLRDDLGLGGPEARRKLTALLGYGRLDLTRLGSAASNRAVLLAGGSIGREQRHTYEVPLPSSLRSKAAWHRFTITLAYAAPTAGHLNRYRAAKVYFTKPDTLVAGGKRIEAHHEAVRRGSLQQEIVDGASAMTFMNGDVFPIHVECIADAQALHKNDLIRYGLVVSVETAERTSTTIHDEIRSSLRLRARDHVRNRIQPPLRG